MNWNFRNILNNITAASNPDTSKRNRTRPSDDTIKKNVDRVKMEMKTLVEAAESARDVNNPDNRDLITIYENALRDPHVHAQLSIARAKITGADFSIIRGGKEDLTAKELLQQEWFEKFLSYVLDSEMWGYVVVEFGLFDEDGYFTDIREFPKRHIVPARRAIAFDQSNRAGDLFYTDQTKDLFLIELGSPDSLGVLELVSREIIWKNFARSDWSQSSEKFGSPILYIKTDVGDGPERDRLEAMARNFASNGYIIADIDDEVNIVQPSSTDYYKIYAENAKFCDEQISKCINGQTGSSDQKSFVGSAEVHERILDDFNVARLRRCENAVNKKMIPFLVHHGYPLEGCKLRFKGNDNSPDSKEEKKSPPTQPAAAAKNIIATLPAKRSLPGKSTASATTPW